MSWNWRTHWRDKERKMAKTNEELAKKLVKTDEKAVSRPRTVQALMEKFKPQFEAVLPKHITADRLARLALTVMSKNPKLYECTDASLCGAVLEAAQLDLDFSVPNECFLVPYDRYGKDGAKTRTDAQFQLGYKGLMKLARRAYVLLGEPLAVLDAQAVYEADELEWERGSQHFLRHQQPRFADRGKLEGFYAYVQYAGGGEDWVAMSVAEMEAHRDRFSKAHLQAVRYKNLARSIWHTDFVPMGCKTVMRQLCWNVLDLAVQVTHFDPRGQAVTSNVLERDRQLEAPEPEAYDLDPTTGEISAPLGTVVRPPQEPPIEVRTATTVTTASSAAPQTIGDLPIPEEGKAAINDAIEATLEAFAEDSATADLVDVIWDIALPGQGQIAEKRRSQILEAVFGFTTKGSLAKLAPESLQAGTGVVEHLCRLVQTGKTPAEALTDDRVAYWLQRERRAFDVLTAKEEATHAV